MYFQQILRELELIIIDNIFFEKVLLCGEGDDGNLQSFLVLKLNKIWHKTIRNYPYV